MLQELKYKMYVNCDCELSVEELKILYEIDKTIDINLKSFRALRNRRYI